MAEDVTAAQKEKEGVGKAGISRSGIFFGPEGALMLSVAILIDIGELGLNLIPVIGQVLSIGIDILALIFFGSWMLFRGGMVRVPKKTGAHLSKGVKWARRLRWLRPLLFFFELIPVWGALPWWTLLVYFELKYS